MKIINVNIPAELFKNGLTEIKMRRLDSVVLLAGKNGSGKSRILNKIQRVLQTKPKKAAIITSSERLNFTKNQIFSLGNKIVNFEKLISENKNPSLLEEYKKQLADSLNKLSKESELVSALEDVINWKLIETDISSDNYTTLNFVPEKLEILDPKKLSKYDQENYSKAIQSVGVAHLANGSFTTIQLIQDRHREATHQNYDGDPFEKQKDIENYEKLEKLISIFLNTNLSRSNSGNAMIFNLELGNSKLSKGQTILIQYCMALYSQRSSLKDLILFMDEPENHLHPEAIIGIINRIQECIPNGQIWISTHSIHILSQFDPNNIWFVDNGTVKHAGKIPEKVLESLIGDSTQIGKLQDFISLPSQYAITKYAIESLFPPAVVMTDSNDKQTLQIRERLLSKIENGNLKILDYGIGKGRLISNLRELDENSDINILSNITYIGYDKYDEDKDICKSKLNSAFGSSENLYYNEMDKLLSDHDKNSFDVVIMCNVLHEIDPGNWISFFRKDGEITKLLKDDGFLLLIEDQQIPIGEKAHKYGFLVLDTPHLKDMFKINSAVDKDFVYSSYNNDSRLKAHYIPKNCLEKIDYESKNNAIKSLSNSASEKIKELRECEPNFVNGKSHGFWTQQYANAELYLRTQ